MTIALLAVAAILGLALLRHLARRRAAAAGTLDNGAVDNGAVDDGAVGWAPPSTATGEVEAAGRQAFEVLPQPIAEVPNITVPPLPGEGALALIEFDGPPGKVAIRHGETIIGRHSDDDVRVNDVRVSRRHARLVSRRDGSFEIQNMTASRAEPNPMLVNGVKLERAAVRDGDVITLGGVRFRFRHAPA